MLSRLARGGNPSLIWEFYFFNKRLLYTFFQLTTRLLFFRPAWSLYSISVISDPFSTHMLSSLVLVPEA